MAVVAALVWPKATPDAYRVALASPEPVRSPQQVSGAAGNAETKTAPAGAVIVDEPTPQAAKVETLSAQAPVETLNAQATGKTPGTDLQVAALDRERNEPVTKSSAEPAAALPAPVPQAETQKPKARQAATATKQAPRTATKNGDDLLDTLMGIIKQQKPAEPKYESMDALIGKLHADERREASAKKTSIDSVATKAQKASDLQSQLRSCPPITTAAGVECRRKICADLGSQSPACSTPLPSADATSISIPWRPAH